MTAIEHVCTILEAVLLNNPMRYRDLLKCCGGDEYLVAGYLRELEALGFVEISEERPSSVLPGLRLETIILERAVP